MDFYLRTGNNNHVISVLNDEIKYNKLCYTKEIAIFETITSVPLNPLFFSWDFSRDSNSLNSYSATVSAYNSKGILVDRAYNKLSYDFREGFFKKEDVKNWMVDILTRADRKKEKYAKITGGKMNINFLIFIHDGKLNGRQIKSLNWGINAAIDECDTLSSIRTLLKGSNLKDLNHLLVSNVKSSHLRIYHENIELDLFANPLQGVCLIDPTKNAFLIASEPKSKENIMGKKVRKLGFAQLLKIVLEYDGFNNNTRSTVKIKDITQILYNLRFVNFTSPFAIPKLNSLTLEAHKSANRKRRGLPE